MWIWSRHPLFQNEFNLYGAYFFRKIRENGNGQSGLFITSVQLSGLVISAIISAHSICIKPFYFHPRLQSKHWCFQSCHLCSACSCVFGHAAHLHTFDMLDGSQKHCSCCTAAAPLDKKGGRNCLVNRAGAITSRATRQEQWSSLHNSSQRNSNWV